MDGPGGSWTFKLKTRQFGGVNKIEHTFPSGGFSSISSGNFSIYPAGIYGPVIPPIALIPSEKRLIYSLDIHSGHSQLMLDDATTRSLEQYIRRISIDTSVVGRINSLQVARYSSTDDVLHISGLEDPRAVERNADEPVNAGMGDPFVGGLRRRRSRSHRRSRKHRQSRKVKSK